MFFLYVKTELPTARVYRLSGILTNMESQTLKNFLFYSLPSLALFIVLAGAFSYQYKEVTTLYTEVSGLKSELASTTKNLELLTTELSLSTHLLSQKFTDLHAETTGLSTTLSTTQQNIDSVKTQVGGVEQAVGSIYNTTKTLQKLAQVDPELLKKYSKVYFLNENYVPANLTQVPTDYTYSVDRPEQFQSESWPYLKTLLDTAKAQGVTLYVKSGYRSFAEQKSLKSSYSVTYGKGTANSFSADQGYSEHQLGSTLDFITSGLNGNLGGFDKTTSYEWLSNNAYRFGFELSYPKGNGYFIYEPWHWRFVGIKLATYLHENKLTFYDIDQREIDKYLVNIFD